MLLTFSVYSAEPYPINESWYTLEEAIEAESHTVAAEANADHIPDPSEDTREAFRLEVVHAATAALQRPGDTYRDPLGVVWSLVEDRSRT
jgi:hypothetical protein